MADEKDIAKSAGNDIVEQALDHFRVHYVLAEIADQTWVYVYKIEGRSGYTHGVTTVHKDAHFFLSREEAETWYRSLGGDAAAHLEDGRTWIEVVHNMAEFCAREDTW